MSRWTEENVWEGECFHRGTWRRVRWAYGLMSFIGRRGKPHARMTLKSGMATIQHWRKLYPRDTFRIRHVVTNDVILADILGY